MTAIWVICTLATALSVGYHFGRRASSATPTWKERTRRVALCRRAISLIGLILASRIQRLAQRKLPGSRGWHRQAIRGRAWRSLDVLMSCLPR